MGWFGNHESEMQFQVQLVAWKERKSVATRHLNLIIFVSGQPCSCKLLGIMARVRR
jgi:hypothetical protein